MKINEIFTSIDGEVNANGQGKFSIFIRFAGCNLNCSYCDTKYAQKPFFGNEISVKQILEKIEPVGLKKVTITGGEPLDQIASFMGLSQALYHAGYITTVETNGSFSLQGYGINSWVVDYKLPSSGMEEHMAQTWSGLSKRDYVKMVIGDREDYEKAKDLLRLTEYPPPNILFSPCAGKTEPKELIEWMIEDRLFDIQINLQLHKYIWKDTKEGKKIL